MTKHAIIVTGSRHLSNQDDIDRLTHLFTEAFAGGGDLFVGDANGVDALARHLAEEQGITVHPFEADWNAYGNSAGPRRNTAMVAAFGPFLARHPDYAYKAFAFPGPKSKGSWDCLRKMVAEGLFVSVWGVST